MVRRIYQVGNAEVTRISDIVRSDVNPKDLIPQWSADPPAALTVSIHAWLLKLANRFILIGAAAGNGKRRPGLPWLDGLSTAFLENLRDAGATPEQIDLVLLTHLSADNIGWSTRWDGARWVPTFPRARYLFPQSEREFFSNPANCTEANRAHFLAQADSVQPLIEAGLVQALEATPPVEGISVFPAPGADAGLDATAAGPGHAALLLNSEGRLALFSGDSFHHPIQVQHPDWGCAAEFSAESAARSRKQILGFAADHDVVVFASHFGGSSLGRIRRASSEFLWRFM